MKVFFRLPLIMLVSLIPPSVWAAHGSDKAEDSNKEIAVLIHGFGRSSYALRHLATKLEHAGYLTHRIEYASYGHTPEQILSEVGQQIHDCCMQHNKSVHFVGHSLGGLLIRAFLGTESVKNLGNVVLIGTPNKGTEIVDKFRDSWWMKLAGPMALALGTDNNSFPNSLPNPYYAVGVIAGNYRNNDNENDNSIPGADDGMVSVESTKLRSGMSDFAIVESGHSSMRNNDTVAALTIRFLHHGGFNQ